MYLLLLVVCCVFGLMGDLYDIVMTTNGIKQGVAVEGNTWLVGSKPTFADLLLRDLLTFVICLAPTIIFRCVANVSLAYASLVALAIFGIKHFMGGHAWAKLGVKL